MTIIDDLRGNSEWAARQWKVYENAVARIGNTETLREANEGLGYNLVKTIPGLLAWIQELEEKLEEKRSRVRTVPKETVEPKQNKGRPLGIPEEHIILNVSDGIELEVVTEEALE